MTTAGSTSAAGKATSAFEKAARARREIRRAAMKLEEELLVKFSSSNLDADEERRRLAASHPMLEQKYFIETDATADFYDIVCDHVIARKSGLYITGEFRVGKTTAIQNAIERLRADMPWLGVMFHSAERKSNQAKSALCNDMAASFECPTSKLQDSVGVVTRFMMAEAVQAGSRTCLLFVDEAQMFTVLQLRYLLEMWNELRKERFLLVSVLVGQEELESLRMLTSAQDHGAVVGRFLVKKYALGGLHNLSDLKNYLGAFDRLLSYPNQAWPYSRYFCKKAFDAGWRLEHEADRFWAALIDHSGAGEKMLAYSGFRLAFVNDAIHSFILDAMRSDGASFRGCNRKWMDAATAAAESDLFIGRDRGNTSCTGK